MRSLRWALCAVLVSPLALAAGRLSSKQDTVPEEPVASSSPHDVAIVLVPPHDPAFGGVEQSISAPAARPRAAQLAVAQPARGSGVRGSHTTVTSHLVVYRIGRPAIVTKTTRTHTDAHPTPSPTPRPKPTATPPKPAPRPKPRPKPTPAPVPPAPPVPPAAPPPPPPVPPSPPPEPPVVADPAPTSPPGVVPAQPAAAATSDGSTRPGNGYGDQNHEHTGPPGQAKKK